MATPKYLSYIAGDTSVLAAGGTTQDRILAAVAAIATGTNLDGTPSPSGGAVISGGQILTPANPAAATDISVTLAVPMRFISFAAQLVTSATVNNRQPQLQITNGGTILFSSTLAPAQAATATVFYQWMAGFPISGATGAQVFNIAPQGLTLPAGAIIKTVTTLLSAGDQWSAIAITGN